MSSNPSMEAPVDVLDPTALDKLRQLDPTGRSGILLRVLRTYEGSLQKLMAQFEAARGASDSGGIRHVAHTLRSSSASVGALALAARCAEVEGMIREGRTEALAPALEAMAAESARVTVAVRAMLAAQGPAA